MRVRICRQSSEAFDGILSDFKPGEIHDLGCRMARRLVDIGCAEYVVQNFGTEVVRPPPNSGAALILVVDDDLDMRQLTATLLTTSSYEVIQASEGREGLAKFCHHMPDLVLLDLNMPVMDGWQFCAGLRKLGNSYLNSTPVLLLTGANGAHQHVDALGAAGLVAKPFDPDFLLRSVDTVLHNGHHSSQNGNGSGEFRINLDSSNR